MILSHQQIREIGNLETERFINFLVKEVIERFFPDGGQADDLTRQVTAIVAEARDFGFEYQDDIEQYTYLKFKYPFFCQKPYSQTVIEILSYPGRDPKKKLNELIYFLYLKSDGKQ